jgi:predicted enzyme related to lactoylglutathione lyase
MKYGEFCWNELATGNVAAAKKFYGEVFGWKFTDILAGDITYTLINGDDKDVGGIWSIPKESEKEIPPHWMSYILVEDADAALEKAVRHGATVVKATMSAGNFGSFAVFRDPTGAHIAVFQPNAE